MNQEERSELFVKLILNAIEPWVEKADGLGWSPLNYPAFRDGILKQVTDLLSRHESLLPLIETGLEMAIRAFFPKMSPAAKTALHDALDMAIDKLRASLTLSKKEESRADGMVAQGAGEFKKGFAKIVEETSKQAASAPKSREAVSIEVKIEYLRKVMNWMEKLPPKKHVEAVKLTGRIETAGGWHRVAELPPKKRLSYLRMTYDKPRTLMETAMAVLRGDKVPEVEAIEKRIHKAGEKLDELGDRHAAAAERKRRQFS
jgi:hypothetical protein